MKITLKNFRAYTKKEIELPDSGMIHLRGDSERGKTTILESIVWSLFGTEGVRNVSPLSSPSAKTVVNMDFRDLSITRTKGPNSFECNGVQDEVAQGVVDSSISTCKHFELSSYVQQKMRNCFLNLKPKEQLNFLERLAVDSNVDEIKIRIKTKVSELKDSVVSLVDKYQYAEQQNESIQLEIDELGTFAGTKVDKTSLINSKKEDVNNLYKVIDGNNSKLQQLLSEKNDPRRNYNQQIEQLEITKKVKEDELSGLILKIKNEQKRLSDFGNPVDCSKIIQSKKKENDDNYSSLNSSNSALQKLWEEKNDTKRSELNQELKQLEVTKRIKEEELKAISEQIKSFQEPCHNDVTRYENEISVNKNLIIQYNEFQKSKQSLFDQGITVDIAKKDQYASASNKIQIDINSLYGQKTMLENEVKNFSVSKECPHCNGKLRVLNGDLIPFNSESSVDVLKTRVAEIENQISKTEANKDKLSLINTHISLFEFFETNQFDAHKTIEYIKSLEAHLIEVEMAGRKHREMINNKTLLEQAVEKLEIDIKKIQQSLSSVRSSQDIDSDIQDINANIAKLQGASELLATELKQLEENQKVFLEYSSIESNIKAIESQKSSIEADIKKLDDSIANLKQSLNVELRSLSEIDSDINNLNKQAESFQNQLQALDIEIKQLESDQNSYNQYLMWKNNYDTLVKQKTNIEASMSNMSKQIDTINKEQEKFLKLEKIVCKAQLNALEGITEAINTSVQCYLDRFFPDSGTSISILPHKVNKDGSISDKIGIEIIHNGVEFKSINDFSGGAENRAILAFQMAISDIVSSPILLLDEPLVGVHSTLRDEIYEYVRDIASEKLVIVVEHGAPDHLFDLVVDV